MFGHDIAWRCVASLPSTTRPLNNRTFYNAVSDSAEIYVEQCATVRVFIKPVHV